MLRRVVGGWLDVQREGEVLSGITDNGRECRLEIALVLSAQRHKSP